MKYEAVFGNQELFDGAGTFTGLDVVVHSIASGIKSYARLSDLTPESLTSHPVCAMRLIIQEPKNWTWEDKKAGRLPEVGAIVVSDGFNEKCEFLGVGMVNGFFVVRLPNGLISINSASSFKPIETPEEKAQREEDEFVDSESFFIDVCTMSGPMKAAYKQGARAAYRKLKGGE